MEKPSNNDFHLLLSYAGIKRVYFIDDYLPQEFDIDNMLASATELLEKVGVETLVQELKTYINLDRVPPS